MKRRNFVKGLAAATALPVVGGGVAYAATTSSSSGSSSSSSSSSLVFESTNYSTLTTTVTTGDGDIEVEYHFYKAITYCADPVNATYQSLNVSVPVTIAGKSVDATNAPILLSNAIGGYLSSSTASATGIGSGGGGGAPTGGAPSASASTSATASATSSATSSAISSSTSTSSSAETDWNNATLALAAGFVVVEPGARGRDLVNSSGDYYGVAPAAIVDLKAAVRYIRHNKGRIPGDVDRIISTGVSAGGALSTLLGASGDSPLYDSYLDAIGAASASDAIFAVAAYCPITDLEHADGAYEYCWGTNDLSTGSEVDQTVSKALKTQFDEYQSSLKLHAAGFGRLTASNYGDYLNATFMELAATTYLSDLSSAARASYLASNTSITWSGDKATFTWSEYTTHVGARKKDAPAFDAFDLSAGENNEFGLNTTESRHFTLYSLRHASGSSTTQLAEDIPAKLKVMNPMYHIGSANQSRSKHWFLRVGTDDTDSSPVIVGNLSAGLKDLGDDVNPLMYWDAPHGVNYDGPAFVTWAKKITGFTK